MEKRNTVLLTIIAVATLLVAIVGATFAYFSAQVTETNKTQTKLQSAELGITFTGTQEVVANSIEPGWSDTKKFTVENTSDYDMTFDINFTGVYNDFQLRDDLTASASAIYVEGANGSTQSGNVQMIGLNDTTIAGSTKVNFALPSRTINAGQPDEQTIPNSYVLPTDNTASIDTTGSTPVITPGTGVFKMARVFIPAGAKEEFTFTFNYEYKAPTEGYTLGDPSDPNNQNVDQGKYFRGTISITANGIDSAS